MLEPTQDEIDAQADALESEHLPDSAQKRARRLVVRFPGGPVYRAASRTRYAAPETLLAAVSGEDAQTILACLAHIDDLGQDRDTLQAKGLSSDPERDRLDWVECILSVLYPKGATAVASVAVANPPALCPVCYAAPCRCAYAGGALCL